MKGVDDYIKTMSPGRVMMTMWSLPTRLPSGLLVYSGLRYMQRRDREREERVAKTGPSMHLQNVALIS